MTETPDQRRDRINDARRESAAISSQVGIDVTSLLVRPVARQAWKRFNEALKQVEPDCAGKSERYVDYPEENRPSPGRAKIMCANCPLYELCNEFARLERPAHGVWGGHVYVDGRRM